MLFRVLHRNWAPLWSPSVRWLSTPAATAAPSYYHSVGRQPLVYSSLGQELERTASDWGSVEAIVSCHERKRHTYRTLLDEVDRMAAGFLKLGLQPGDHVGIWGPNSMSWYMTMLAAARVGLVSVGINPAFQKPEVEYCLKKVHIRALVAPESYKTQNYYEILQQIAPELSDRPVGKLRSDNLPHLKAVVMDSPSKLKGTLPLDELLELADADAVAAVSKRQSEVVADAPCNVQFTSGTTGQPKAAVLSHFNIVNNGRQIGERNQLGGQRICVQVPLFHVYGVVITAMAAISQGATLVLPAGGFSAAASLDAIVQEKCSVIHGTPTMYVDLIRRQRSHRQPLKTARMAITGGAPCSPQLYRDMKDELGVHEVRAVYGLTETTSVVFQSRSTDGWENTLNTVGHLLEHTEAKVVDERGQTVPFGQPGELCIRGYCTMLGYYGDDEKTREVIGADKWLRTGDQFVLEADGYGRIVGRLKDMIIRGGENIFPKEVEDFLNAHPDIAETHIVGVPDERMGEELCAFVRLRDGVADMPHDTLKQYSKGKLAHFKVPRYVVPIGDFPKTVSGKIQKFKLLQLFEAMQSTDSK